MAGSVSTIDYTCMYLFPVQVSLYEAKMFFILVVYIRFGLQALWKNSFFFDVLFSQYPNLEIS